MKRREFISTAATSMAAFSAMPIAAMSQVKDETKKKDEKSDKIVVSILQSDFVGGPPEADPYHPKFDKSLYRNEVVLKNIDNIENLLEESGRRKSDIVLTTEDFKGLYPLIMDIERPELLREFAETIPGPTTDRFGTIAKKYNMYIITNLLEVKNGDLHNTAVLIDRKGQVQGTYRKVQLPVPESWVLKPGDEFPVFETDFAKIGIAICYDMMFPEVTRILALQGADIIFMPTGGYGWTEDLGESTLKVRAADNMVWFAMAKSATTFGAGRSAIVNPLGQVVADAGYEKNYVLTSYINPKDTWVQPENGYGSVLSGIPNMRARLSIERRPDVYKLLTDPNPQVLKKYPEAKLLQNQGKDVLLKTLDRLKKQAAHDAQDTEKRIGFRRDIL